MSEVEKMYENCNIKPKKKGYCDWDSNCPYPHHNCNDECPYWKYEDETKYPPFTAEKQLFLLQLLARKSHITIGLGLPWGQYDDSWWTVTSKNGGLGTNAYKFEEALASFVNSKWQDLTDNEKAEIKEILSE